MPPRTDDGRVMAIAQIDYRQYDIWDIFGICVRPEKQFFVGKTTKYIFPGTQCQNSDDSLAKNTPNAPNFISSICLPKPKNGISQVEKNLHRASVVRANSYSGTLLFMKLHYHLCDSKRNAKASEPRRIFSHNLHNALFYVLFNAIFCVCQN